MPTLTDHNTATVRTTWFITFASALAWLIHVVFDIEVATNDPTFIVIIGAFYGILYRLSVVLSEKVPYFGYVLFGVNRSPEYSEPPPDVPALADEGFAESGIIWTIVGILAIIALAIWIIANV
jgi:hypothetical protein